MGTELGHVNKAAWKNNAGTWGVTAPVLAGANDGFEFNNESMKSNVALIMNEGISGSPFRRPGSAGNHTPGGDIDFDFYYRCSSLRMVAQLFGADTQTQQGGTAAYLHELVQQSSVAGKHGCLVIPGSEAVREYPYNKVSALKFKWAESDQRGKITATLASFDQNVNIGTADAAFVSASAAVADGARTILAQALADFTPSPLTATKGASVSAITAVIVYLDRRGVQKSLTITVADFVSNVWTGTDYVSRVISITQSGTAGSGNVSWGVSQGINNDSTRSAITTISDRDVALFSQMRVYLNAQAGADFAAGDEAYVSGVEIGITANMDSRVTTQFGYRIEEPAFGGGGWPEVTLGINWSAFTDRNRKHLIDQMRKSQLKGKVVLTGPQVASSGYAHSITFWLNGIQFDTGDPNVGGPGVEAFDVQGKAHSVVAVPTGFPSGHSKAVKLEIINAETAAYV